MESGEDDVSGARPSTEKTTDNGEAAKLSAGLTEPSSRRGGSRRRVKNASVSVDSADSRTDAGSSARVLRARGTQAGRTDESKSATCQKKAPSLQNGTSAGGRVKHPAVISTAIKKSTSKKASRRTIGPKPSKSRKGKQRAPARAPRVTPATACQPNTGMETSAGEAGPFKGCDNAADAEVAADADPPFRDSPNDVIDKPQRKMQKSKRQALLLQKQVTKEESGNEEEEEESDIKKEESPEVITQSEDEVGDKMEPPKKRGRQPKDDKAARLPKRRKKPPVQYVRCEMEGCGTVLAHPRYLQHHIKYQHLMKKKYVCDHPSCGRLFRLQKQLLRHAKHHTDQRDYICEYCARAFKSSHNLAVHRMIHTGEKPIQCEICGFTCRQKASLNWHMKKHDAEASYQFSCSICGKKFEKKDSVVAHKAKSHPEILIAEALAANGGSVIKTPTSVPEAAPEAAPEPVPALTSSDQASASQDSQEAGSNALTPLQQVALPLAPQTQLSVPQGQFLQMPTHHVVQVVHEQQAPTLLHLTAAAATSATAAAATTAAPSPLSSTSQPQLIQLSGLPASSVAPVPSVYSLLTLSSVTTLAPQQQWGREADKEVQLPGEGELWDRVVVGDDHQDVGDMMWEDSGERRREGEGIVWERESERQILLPCAEVHGDTLM